MIDFLDGRDGLAGDDLDAAILHLVMQMPAHVVVEAAQDVFAAVDQRHLRAEPVEDAGELDGDIAAALDQNALGQVAEVKRLVRRDGVLEAGDARRRMGRGAGRHQDGFGVDARAARQAHGVGVFDDGARL